MDWECVSESVLWRSGGESSRAEGQSDVVTRRVDRTVRRRAEEELSERAGVAIWMRSVRYMEGRGCGWF